MNSNAICSSVLVISVVSSTTVDAPVVVKKLGKLELLGLVTVYFSNFMDYSTTAVTSLSPSRVTFTDARDRLALTLYCKRVLVKEKCVLLSHLPLASVGAVLSPLFVHAIS